MLRGKDEAPRIEPASSEPAWDPDATVVRPRSLTRMRGTPTAKRKTDRPSVADRRDVAPAPWSVSLTSAMESVRQWMQKTTNRLIVGGVSAAALLSIVLLLTIGGEKRAPAEPEVARTQLPPKDDPAALRTQIEQLLAKAAVANQLWPTWS